MHSSLAPTLVRDRTLPGTPSARRRRVALPAPQHGVATLYGDELLAGAPAGEYVILERIGRGGFSRVYRARHRVLGREVAIKVLEGALCSGHALDRFVREARVLARLRHPAIVTAFDFGRLPDGRPFYVMDLLCGQDLLGHLLRAGRLGEREILALCQPLCEALAAAHDAGILHRDVKAENVFLEDSGGVKLLDFGLAKLVDDSGRGESSSAQRLGTPGAMAPEQITGGAVDERTDVYGLGALAYHALCGRPPFEADDPALLERLCLEAPPIPPARLAPVSPAVQAVVLRALAKRPEDRHTSANHFRAALERAVLPRHTRPRGLPVRSASALAIAADVALAPEADPEALAAAERALSELEQTLVRSGFQIVVATGTSLLAVRPGPAPLDAELADALASAACMAPLCARAHTGTVTLAGESVVGGPLLALGSWPAQATIVACAATPASPQATGGASSAGGTPAA